MEPALRTMMNGRLPVWLSLVKPPQSLTKPTEICSPQCLNQGLSWAKTLGDASRNGFNVIYKPIDVLDLYNPSMSHYVTLLHKKVVGEKVFDTKMVSGSRMFSHFYSHCTKNVSGAFTVIGINTADSRLKVSTKMPNKYTGSEVRQYILTVNDQNGKVQLNGDDINSDGTLEPFIKMKRANKAISLILPPLSVGFWVFPMANLRECIRFEDEFEENDVAEAPRALKSIPKTSKELLLQQLIVEALNREEGKPSRDRFKRHTIIKKDASDLHRNRRDIANSVPRMNTLIDEELIKDQQGVESLSEKMNRENSDNHIYKRNRRFILNSSRRRRSGNVLDAIYKEVDDVKRRNIFAPLKLKDVVFGKHARAKRQIHSSLGKLFEKFDLKKPRKLNLKQPIFKKDSYVLPPVATVHDIYTPNSAESKVFKSSENKDLPHGDVYFDIGNEDAQSPDYVAFDDKTQPQKPQQPIQRQRNEEPIRDVSGDANVQRAPEQYFDYMDMAAPQPQQPIAKPQPASVVANIPRFGELWEADVYQRPNTPQQEQNQQQLPAEHVPQQQMEFVVQELQPTYQKNRENLQKARNNLQQYYVAGPPQSAPISTYLTNADGYQGHQYDSDEAGFFSSKRRRRSIDDDDKMNDEIEHKVQKLHDKMVHDDEDANEDELLSRAVDKINLLDKMLEIVDHIDRHQSDHSTYDKLSEEIKELEAFLYHRTSKAPLKANLPNRKWKWTPNEIRRKCKVMSTSLEQKCLREEEQFEKYMFKREAKYDHEDKTKKPIGEVLKKLFPKTTALRNRLREKRNAIFKTTSIEDDLDHPNYIERELHEESGSGIPIIKTIMLRASNSLSEETKNAPQPIVNKWKPYEVEEALAQTDVPASNTTSAHMPRIMKTFNGYVDKVMDIVNKYVFESWKMLS